MGRPKSKAAAGTRLFMGDEGGDATTRFGGIRKFGELPTLTIDEFETTEVDAMIGDTDEVDWLKYYEPGKEDPGQVMITISPDNDNVSAVYKERRVIHSWKIVFKDGSFIPFEGWIKTIKPVQNEKEDTLFEVTIRVTKPPILQKAPAAAPAAAQVTPANAPIEITAPPSEPATAPTE